MASLNFTETAVSGYDQCHWQIKPHRTEGSLAWSHLCFSWRPSIHTTKGKGREGRFPLQTEPLGFAFLLLPQAPFRATGVQYRHFQIHKLLLRYKKNLEFKVISLRNTWKVSCYVISSYPTSKSVSLFQIPPIQLPAHFDKQVITAFPTGLLFHCPTWSEPWTSVILTFERRMLFCLGHNYPLWFKLQLISCAELDNLPRSPKLWVQKFSPAQGEKHPAGCPWTSTLIISLLFTFFSASPTPNLALLLILNSWHSISPPGFTFFFKKKQVSFFLPISPRMVSVPTLPFELRGSLKLPLFRNSPPHHQSSEEYAVNWESENLSLQVFSSCVPQTPDLRVVKSTGTPSIVLLTLQGWMWSSSDVLSLKGKFMCKGPCKGYNLWRL